MTLRNYINDSPQTTTTGALTAGQTSVTVVSVAGFPSAPYIAALGLDANGNFTSSTELVLVTAAVGNVLTVTRGFDFTSGISHSSGETFNHVGAAIDLREANAHVNAASGVHSVTGAVVGTTDSQTLSNKTLATPTLTGTAAGASLTLSGTAAVTGAVTAASFTANGNGVVAGVVAPKNYTNEAAAGTLPAGDIVYLSAPTGAACVAGLYVSQGAGVWFPLNPTAKDFLNFVPGGTLTTPGAGSALWATLGNLTVPAWATKARIAITATAVITSAAGASAGVTVKLGAITGTAKRIVGPATTRFQFEQVDQLAGLTAGVNSLTLQAGFVSAGTLSLDAAISQVDAVVDYLP